MINIFEKNRYGLLEEVDKKFFMVDENNASKSFFNMYMSIFPFEFSPDTLTCDFLITRDEKYKHKYYGIPVYTRQSIIKYIVSRNHRNITSSKEHLDLMSMVRSEDIDSIYLGITTLIKSLSYNDVKYLSYMINNRIYPYEIFSYDYTAYTVNKKRKLQNLNELDIATESVILSLSMFLGKSKYKIARRERDIQRTGILNEFV